MYETVEEPQKDLDIFIEHYNNKRVHRGYRTKGRTPIKALKDFLNQPKTINKKAA